MKKVISLLASVAMLISAASTAFAAVPADANPTGKITLVGDESKTRTISGETYYMYTATVELEGLGTLGLAPAEQDGSVNVGTGISQFEIGYVGNLQAGSGAGSTSDAFTLKQVKASQTNNGFSGIYVQFAATDLALVSDKAPDGKITVTSKFYGKPGDTFTLQPTLLKVGYTTIIFDEDAWQIKSAPEGIKYANITYDKDVYTLPEFSAKTMDMTASLKGKYENGYVWEATVTPGKNALSQFKAKFTDAATSESVERSVSNPGSMDFSGTGSLTFNVGLKTARTLSGAEFTAYATADDYKTVAAPVE